MKPRSKSPPIYLSLSVSVSVSVALYQKEEEEVRNGIDELDTDGDRCERIDITAEERCQTSATIFRLNVKHIRHWLEEESASASKYAPLSISLSTNQYDLCKVGKCCAWRKTTIIRQLLVVVNG